MSLGVTNFNCRKIYISGFQLSAEAFKRYFKAIQQLLSNNLPQNWTKQKLNQNLCQIDSTQFVNKIQQDPKNVGICLASIGVSQCSYLNQIKGIRAAFVHTQYLAKMCRQHNNANVCLISTDCIGQKLAANLVLTYVKNDFDGQTKNKLRLGLLEEFQTKYLQQK